MAPGVPAWLDDVVAHATAAAAEERFPTAAALDEALARPGAAAELLVNGAAGACVLCNGPDPLALGLCPACGGSPEATDTLVFLRRGADASARRAAALRLETVLPEVGREAAGLAARGERPLFRVSRAGMPRLLEEMERRELPARAVPIAGAWGALPGERLDPRRRGRHRGRSGGNRSAADAALEQPAGRDARPARRRARRPDAAGGGTPARGRAAARPRAHGRRGAGDAAARAPRGASWPTWCGRAAPYSTPSRGRAIPRGLAPSLEELVTAACRAARDLADLDDQLTRFERQRERLAAASPERLDALARCERTRDALVQRLLEAMTAVSRLRTQQAELSDAGESTLGDVTRELGRKPTRRRRRRRRSRCCWGVMARGHVEMTG